MKNDLRVLAIETSGDEGGVAFLRGGELVSQEILTERRAFGRDFVNVLDKILVDGLRPRDNCDLIAVDVGPGSFTGLRIGITIAKTLAWSSGIGAVGVVSLDALAWEKARELRNHDQKDKFLLPVIDAFRGEVFCSLYKLGDPELEGEVVYEWPDARLVRLEDYLVRDPQGLSSMASFSPVVFGNGVIKHRDEMCAVFSATDVEEEPLIPSPYAVGVLGGEMASGDTDPFGIKAFYLRRASVTMKK